MLITRIRIHNYKSFQSSSELFFGPGFNVILGANNAGKTALLEALSLTFSNNPHRSPATIPRPGSQPDPKSTAELSIELRRSEFFSVLADHSNSYAVSLPDGTRASEAAERFLTSLTDPVNLNVVYDPQIGFTTAECPAWPVPDTSSAAFLLHASPALAEPKLQSPNPHSAPRSDRIFMQAAAFLRARLYLFRAERMNIGEAGISNDPTLAPNAANLPAVLHLLLSKNPSRFDRYLLYVKTVFPEIRQVTVPPVGGSARILLWSTDPKEERDDLAIPLSESGTGISQVLALLYVIVTADYPRVFLIDEPQSFLHPGALRKLLAILAGHPQHQCIISTHSPIVLTAMSPSSVLLLRKVGAETTAQKVDPSEAGDLRAVLAEVGARLSDVFGADNVLWVEGRTEELCFPAIWENARTDAEKVTATVILGVRHTGDFERRDARATVELYRRLTQGGALLPPALGFIFDREGRSKQEQDDLRRESGGLVRFLPRRMFENYLLAPEAIASLANAIGDFRSEKVTREQVATWIEAHKWDHGLLDQDVSPEERTDELWYREVRGAGLLEKLFADLSERRVTYDKVRHGLVLTKWTCEHQPEVLADVVTLIREAMMKAG